MTSISVVFRSSPTTKIGNKPSKLPYPTISKMRAINNLREHTDVNNRLHESTFLVLENQIRLSWSLHEILSELIRYDGIHVYIKDSVHLPRWRHREWFRVSLGSHCSSNRRGCRKFRVMCEGGTCVLMSQKYKVMRKLNEEDLKDQHID